MFPSFRSMERQHSFCVPRVCAPKKHHEEQCVLVCHTTPEKSCENTVLFVLLGLPSALIRHENGASSKTLFEQEEF